jgi:SAM-dependent methyltransferase
MKSAEYVRMFEVEATHWWYAGMREILKTLLDSAPGGVREDARILDAGCGTGFNLSLLGEHAVGVDASEVALELCRQRGIANALRADIMRLPFPDASFERVISLDVLSDRGVVDDAAGLDELCRVLAPQGLLVLRLPALPFLRRRHDTAVETTRRYTRQRLRRMLEDAGVRPLRITYCNSLLLPVVALVALRDRTLPREPRSDLDPLPAILTSTFRACLRAEAHWLRRRDLPLGASVLALAQKPG